MNKIYRVVFNHVAGVWQAVAEVASARGKSSGRAATVKGGQARALALGAAIAFAAPGAWADGGAGASATGSQAGGVGGTPASPAGGVGQTGGAGFALTGGGGGGAGFDPGTGLSTAGGAGGGATPQADGGAGGGVVETVSLTGTTADATGQAGAAGAVPSAMIGSFVNGGGGGGASGGAGLLTTDGTRTLTGEVMGGAGGAGGANSSPTTATGGGGGGGEGGAGVLRHGGDVTVIPGAQVHGGQGGSGGASVSPGGGGGDGGAGMWWVGGAGQLLNSGLIAGGSGGLGGSGFFKSGAAGNGGMGVQSGNDISIFNTGTIAGGQGGSGGTKTMSEGAGNGGTGIQAGSNVFINNSGTIAGGQGGALGASVLTGASGHGGAGVQVGGGAAIVNSGTIAGGQGGPGRLENSSTGSGAGGIGVEADSGGSITNFGIIAGGHGGVTAAGGAGISGSALMVINRGTISGGQASAGAGIQANAITFTGGNNTLQIDTGSTLNGNVVGATGVGTSNQLRLGGAGSDTFAASEIGGAAKYQNFGAFEKIGAGTWTLTGATGALTPWLISRGILSVGSDASLGDTAGMLTLNGGTLRTTATFESVRSVVLGASGGTFEPTSGTTLTLGGVGGSTGSLTMVGTGTLLISGASSYSGGTTLSSGTLSINSSSALGSGTLTLNGGTLNGGRLRAGGTSLSNSVVVNGDFNIAAAVDLSGNVQLNNTIRVTMVSDPGGNDTRLQLTGALSGAGGITYDSTLPTHDAANKWPGIVYLGGSTGNNYAGPTLAQGNVWVMMIADADVVVVPNDLTISDNAVVVSGYSEQIGSNARLTVNSHGQGVSLVTGVASTTIEGFSLGTWVAIAPVTQTIGSLYGDGTVGLGSGTLRVGAGGFNGVISDGSYARWYAEQTGGTVGGKLEKYGPGTLTLGGANTYSGGTALKGGTLAVANNNALGTGTLAMDDNTTLAFAADGLTVANPIAFTGTNDPTFDTRSYTATLTGGISGAADLTKQGVGTLILGAANNSYAGSTTVAQGTLRAGATNTFNAASAHTVASGATLDLAGFSQTVAGVTNAGTVSLKGRTPGTLLTATGPWVGKGGTLALGTALGTNASPTDKLLLRGTSAVASGSTKVVITNLDGLGALTTGDGIEVISAQGGATTTAQTTKDAFALAAGHVDAGAYEYRLYAADATGAGENWFLRSSTNVAPPSNPSGAPVVTYRPEASLYAALPSQLHQGNLAMLGDLHKRVGDDDVRGATEASIGTRRRAWARVLSTDIDIQQGGTVSPTSKGRLTGFQAGTDLLAAPNWRAGLYVGQLDGDATVNGFASGVSNLRVGRNDLRSQYLGVYGTYTGDSGFYADAVVQSGRHRYTVEPMLNAGTEGKGNSLLGSIEVGQAFALGGSGWRIEPQLQLIHQHMDLGNSAIVGAVVQPHADSGWIVRAGVRVKGEIDTGMGALQPYGRFNVYKTSSGTEIARFINGATTTDIAAPTGGTSTELAGGFTLALGQTTSLYGEVGKLWASGGNAKMKSSINGSLGVKVRW